MISKGNVKRTEKRMKGTLAYIYSTQFGVSNPLFVLDIEKIDS